MSTTTTVSMLSVLCSLLVASSLAMPTQLYEGDACQVTGGPAGVCRRLRDCPSVVQQLRKRSVKPTHCGFMGMEVVVCCGVETDSPRTNLRLRKSDEACQAYRERDPNQLITQIIGGELALEGEFTHMASLGFISPDGVLTFRCGGSLISDQYVLTAAHCVSNRNIGLPRVVRLGSVDLEDESGNAVDYGVEKIIRHPRYVRKLYYDDVALIKLSRGVVFSRFIFPACLYTKSHIPADKLTVTGWGAIDNAGSVPSRFLLKADLSTAPRAVCTRELQSVARFRLPEGLKDNMVCAEDQQRMADTCVGDSGGPLQIAENPASSVWSVVGVTSFGSNPCGGKSVYAQVSSYIDWIETIVWP